MPTPDALFILKDGIGDSPLVLKIYPAAIYNIHD